MSEPIPFASPRETLARDRVRIVLVGTQHPGNIGAAGPRDEDRWAWAAGAWSAPEKAPDRDTDRRWPPVPTDLVEQAPGLRIAERGRGRLRPRARLHRRAAGACSWNNSSPTRARPARWPSPRKGPVALVFGRERTGLDNNELQLCHAAVHIPSDPAFSSLNLAAAVQVLSYEVRMALLGAGDVPAAPAPAAPTREGLAPHSELEGFFAQLAEALDAIDFHKGRTPDSAMRKLRRLYLRAGLDSAEVRLLRGILADTQRMAMLAGQTDVSDRAPKP
jgi:tRNA (cytidine32/uridine32-2'-O)-methyltransferase